MKKYILVIMVWLMQQAAYAQLYNNEWIDYSKTYYKFKVGSTGLYRINQQALPAAISSVPAEQFQLWRNGKQIALYTSNSSGAIPANGYIEFWGEQNDGKPDNVLYKNTANQLTDTYSLQTDTAAYYLTVNSSGNNLRLVTTVNNIAGNTLSPEPYFTYTYRKDFKDIINRGKAVDFGEYVYSSTYDVGEFWSSNEFYPGGGVNDAATDLNVAAGFGTASLRIAVAGNSYLGGGRLVKASINGINYISQGLGPMDAKIMTSTSIPLSTFSSNVANTSVTVVNNNTNDHIVAGFIELTYPRLFNFSGAANFSFKLPATAQGNYLRISNFTIGTSLPVLYDLTNYRRYTADTSNGIVQFALLPSAAERLLVLVNEDAGNIKTVSNFIQRNFINYSVASNQGDYLIVTNKLLAGNTNVTEQYRQYRAGAAGGGYNAKIVDIDELVDQFAFGIKKHPLSVKNFLKYARNNFTVKPKFVFLIGKAVTYDEYRANESSPNADRLNLVPTFGWPASDNLLASDNYDPVATTPVGRLAAISPEEVKLYLDKMVVFEQQQANSIQTIDNKAWMKTMVHVVGANDASLDAALTAHLNSYEAIARDTFIGASVYNFNKTTTGSVTPIANALMQQLFDNGISLLNYFGHSAATALDYNLNDPTTYNNYGKYPVFIVNGCDAGNIYSYDTSRLGIITSLSEKFVLAKDRGVIGFIASTHFGVENYLDYYNQGIYRSLAVQNYGKAISYSVREGVKYLLGTNYIDSMTKYLHAEETVLHGDPALKLNSSAKPDFAVEEPQVFINPSFISVADNKFSVKAYFYNLGKATGDSVSVLMKRIYPNGTSEIIVSKNIQSVRFKDSVILELPIVASRDKGQNQLIVSIDNTGRYDELSESNNTITKTFFIYEDELNPVYPYNFSIVNKSGIKLVASTANPVSPLRNYAMEIDTTELFNSSAKVAKTISSFGGELEFDPGIAFSDSSVYYWRVAPVPASGPYRWNNSSFVYLANASAGYNQSHVYQHLKSSTSRMYMDSFSRQWKFTPRQTAFQVIHSIFQTSGTEDIDFSIQINGLVVTNSACLGHSVIFNVFDPVTLKPLYNQAVPSVIGSGSYGGFLGSALPCAKLGAAYNFEFSYLDTTGRRKMRDFMDWVPDGYIVTARLIFDAPYDQNPFADTWKKDELKYGVGNTAYQRLKDAGFSNIDSFSYPRTWVMIYQKKTSSFIPTQQLSKGLYDRIVVTRNILSPDTLGTITSPLFGPAKAWKSVKWRGKTIDATPGDKATVDVIGVNAAGQEQVLYNLSLAQQDADISSVSTVTYPYLKLRMHNQDSIHLTPYQLQYWRILYDPVPEGALAANLLYNFKDTLELGEKVQTAIAFKNISDVSFTDSIKVKLNILDKSNVATVVPISRLKKLAPGDTAVIRYTLDSKAYSGNNTFFLDVNPDKDQPEQYHPNNFLYKNFFVKNDNYNPLLDVTFDGVHILNNDIVAAKPHVLIKLKDESKYLLLNDTSLVTVQLQYPDNSFRRFTFNTDTLRFTPAIAGAAENAALVDFAPFLTQDGQYQLFVRGKDKTGNPAGFTDYRVSFQVYNKPMISNMFNYPNPFTSSTAFVFTITGSQVPQNIRIQILTITGKIVKEITKEELGTLHIGRNITDYKWDGTDQYGQKLANGVYIYRVITNLNGKSLDKFNITDTDGSPIDTDKYFNKGYGKMYLMR